jgi:ABC-2 type transport system permease protein
MIARQVRFTNLAFLRNPAAAIFTIGFPLGLLVLLTALLGDGTVERDGVTYDRAGYYVVAMAVFGLVSACYTNVAMSLTLAREQGILKRLRGTPFPLVAYLMARLAHATIVGFALVAVTVGYGAVALGTGLPSGTDLARFVATIAIGSACFAALGLAVSTLVPNAAAAPPLVNGVMFPLLLLSGVFVPIGDDAPGWVTAIADVFPVKPFFDAAFASFFEAASFVWSDLTVVTAWLVGAALLAVSRFRWEPAI